jgi:hypothetical protein
MKFKPGDRVLMVQHADWKNDAVGTIISEGRVRTLYDGSTDFCYWIEFDEPQRDLTDEMHGQDRTYDSSTVLERYLRPRR